MNLTEAQEKSLANERFRESSVAITEKFKTAFPDATFCANVREWKTFRGKRASLPIRLLNYWGDPVDIDDMIHNLKTNLYGNPQWHPPVAFFFYRDTYMDWPNSLYMQCL